MSIRLSYRAQQLLLSALGDPQAVADLISDIENIVTGEIADGAITDPKVATGIDAAKIGNGSVSNSEFQALDGVSSSIQSQINGKQASGSYVTSLTGDVTASGPGAAAATVAAVGGASASDIAISVGDTQDATSANNADSIVKRSLTGQILVSSIGVGNSASATTPGTVVKKIEIFDASGASLRFIAVYDAIS